MLQEESKNLGKNTILSNSKPVLTLIPTPIGNLKDITLRSIEALGRAEVVLCEDTRIAKKLYTLLQGRFAEIINSLRMVSSAISLDSNTKTFISFHTHNQNDYLASLSPDFFTKEIIYLSDAGSPSICDPGAALVAYAQTHNLPYEVLPGCCALTTAWAFSGITSQGFVFGGFLAHKQKDRHIQILHLITSNLPVIVYESPHRLLETLKDLIFLLPDASLFAIKEMTKLHQQHFLGTPTEVLKALHSTNIQGEWVLIIQANTKASLTLYEDDICALPLAPKTKAKLLARLHKTSTKHIYKTLLENT